MQRLTGHDVQDADVRPRDADTCRPHLTQVAPNALVQPQVERPPLRSLFGQLFAPIGAQVGGQQPLAIRRSSWLGDPPLQGLVVRSAQTFEHDQRRHDRHTAGRQAREERAAIGARALIERRIEAVFERCLAGREDVVEGIRLDVSGQGQAVALAAAPIAR